MLGAWYMLMLLRRVFFGELKEPAHEGHGAVDDLNGREIAALAPIAALCLFLGVWPQPFLDTVRPDCRWSPASPTGPRLAPPTGTRRSPRRRRRPRPSPNRGRTHRE